MPSDEKAISRVIKYLRKSLGDLSDVLQDTVDQINDFSKSLKKAENDIKGVKVSKEKTVSSSSVKLTSEAQVAGNAKTQAASTLFSLLGGAGGSKTPATAVARGEPPSPISKPPTKKGPPTRAGPPKPPTKKGSPTAPPSKSLPPPPRLPPAKGKAGPPSIDQGVVQAPSYVKRPAPPVSPPGLSGAVPPPAPAVASVVAPQAGGSLGTLRDEMLDELSRLKKIMRGD